MPGRERETDSSSRCRVRQPIGGLAMYENDFDVDVSTPDELLAELGLDAYTIRKIRDEAGGEEEFCSV